MSVNNGLPPIHPGIFLKEILEQLEIPQKTFASAIGVSPRCISHVIKGSRAVTAELALLFAKALGQNPRYWTNLQVAYDLKTAKAEVAGKVCKVQQLSSTWDKQISADIAEGRLDALADEALDVL